MQGLNKLKRAASRAAAATRVGVPVPSPEPSGEAQLKKSTKFRADIEILSSLPLQMLLYFNLRYSVVYFLVGLLLAEAKV